MICMEMFMNGFMIGMETTPARYKHPTWIIEEGVVLGNLIKVFYFMQEGVQPNLQAFS